MKSNQPARQQVDDYKRDMKLKDKFMVSAFAAFYNAATEKRCSYTSKLECFVEAIVKSSDDAFERARAKNPNVIADYYKAVGVNNPYDTNINKLFKRRKLR